MTAELTFDLPEDEEEFRLAVGGKEAIGALWEIANDLLRTRFKHRDLSDAEVKILEEITEEFWNIIQERGIILE